MPSLEELILNKISIFEYFDKNYKNFEEYVTKDGQQFKKNYKLGFTLHDKGVCINHPDRDPSMGAIKDRNHKGVYLYHCFGCGDTGNVIKMHQIFLNKKNKKDNSIALKYITYEQAMKLLADELGINQEDVTEDGIDMNNEYVRRQLALKKSMSSYTIRDFENEVLSIRLGDYSVQNRKLLINRAINKLLEKDIEARTN